MAHLELWKITVDVLLMASLCVLCIRLLRAGQGSGKSGRAAELEGSLRSLIREADDAGRSLNDELHRRQRELDRLLRELQGIEASARRTVQTMQSPLGAGDVDSRMPTSPLSNRVEVQVEPPSFTAAKAPRPTQAPSPQAPRTQQRPQRVNIYGEPIEDAPQAAPSRSSQPPARTSYQTQSARPQPKSSFSQPPEPPTVAPIVPQPIATKIEQTVEPSGAAAAAADDIYRAAEDLLRAGKDLAFVAATTRLPMDEVKVLSRVVSQQIIAKSSAGIVPERVIAPETPHVKNADPRLGVFGAVRRQVQTL